MTVDPISKNFSVQCHNPQCIKYNKVVLITDLSIHPERQYCQFCGMSFVSRIMNEDRQRTGKDLYEVLTMTPHK